MIRLSETKWVVATTLARWSVNPLYKAFKGLLALLLVIGVGVFSYKAGEKQGIHDGLDFYHQMCENGGMVLNQERGTAVVCQLLTQAPEKELDKT